MAVIAVWCKIQLIHNKSVSSLELSHHFIITLSIHGVKAKEKCFANANINTAFF